MSADGVQAAGDGSEAGGGFDVVATSIEADGSELILAGRDGTYQIRVDGRELMDSRNTVTERDLARLAFCRSSNGHAPWALVGGLGMGFTLRAALDLMGETGRVTVVEISPAIILWNRGPLSPLARHPLADPRVDLVCGDVRTVLAAHRGRYDLVLLDVDNGPGDLARAGNEQLYHAEGLADIRDALRPGGVAAVWSAGPAPDLEERFLQVGLSAWSETVCPRPGDTRIRHTIVLAARPAV
jgi:spermidine synthase